MKDLAIIGTFYGVWEVLEELPSSHCHRKVRCKCSKCGAVVDKFLSNIKKPERQNHNCNILPTDLTGYVFGHLTVLGRDETKPKGHGCHTYHICQCDCPDKTIVSIPRTNLIRHKTTSCNSEYHKTQLRGEKVSLVGKTFLKLRVDFPTSERASNKDIIYSCTCLECGKSNIKVSRSTLTNLKKKSCGCISRSAGELLIEKILIEKGYEFETEIKIPELNNCRFDFKIYINNSFVYLEYDGEQHYKENSYYYDEKGHERDLLKNQYCIDNNIPLYRIPYWDYNKIAKDNDLFKLEYLIN